MHPCSAKSQANQITSGNWIHSQQIYNIIYLKLQFKPSETPVIILYVSCVMTGFCKSSHICQECEIYYDICISNNAQYTLHKGFYSIYVIIFK